MATTTDQQQIDAARATVSRFQEALDLRIERLGLEPGSYELEFTACGHAEGPEFKWRSDCVYLDQITALPNRQGIGSKLMQAVLKTADEMSITIVLNAASQKFDERDPWWMKRLSRRSVKQQAHRFTALSQEELEAWYQRLGFDFVSADTDLMQRKPRKPV